jgi:hypothetical protein
VLPLNLREKRRRRVQRRWMMMGAQPIGTTHYWAVVAMRGKRRTMRRQKARVPRRRRMKNRGSSATGTCV